MAWVLLREHAPNVGVPVMVSNGRHIGLASLLHDIQHESGERSFIWSLGWGGADRITYWQPLPPLPGEGIAPLPHED